MALLPVGSHAQGTCVSGYLVDASSHAPLRFAAVQLLRDGAGVVADEHGYFELESTGAWDHDSLVVLLDAVRSTHEVAHDRSQGLRLAVAVPPVTVSPVVLARRRRTPAPVTDLSPRIALSPAISGLPGAQYAFLAKNDAPTRRNILHTVSFYIGDGALPREVFRLRLYHVSDHGPGAELLTENVLLWASRRNEWFTLNLAPYHVAVPETGCFVALEYIVDDGIRPSYYQSILEDYTPTGPFMRPVVDANARTVWYNSAGRGWALLPLHNGLFGRYGAMIKLEVDTLK